MVKRLKLKRMVLELDSQALVVKLNSEDIDRSVHGPMIGEVKKAICEVDDHVVKWATRSANSIAHILAKEGCGLK
jgi:hypothetical protein